MTFQLNRMFNKIGISYAVEGRDECVILSLAIRCRSACVVSKGVDGNFSHPTLSIRLQRVAPPQKPIGGVVESWLSNSLQCRTSASSLHGAVK